ncbi:hypothetical protein U1872_06350 [Sphingomonas sp. RB3P16]|uniref:hypothetical protein n=1 Tax=Parasphingomonas frigoris TaxID=3096163 RepID=UPI002FC6290B
MSSAGPSFFEGIAIDALALGKKNEIDIASHEDLCAERYQNINTNIGEIKSFLKWACTTGFMIIIGLLCFLAKMTWEAKDQAAIAAAAKIEMLQRQIEAPPRIQVVPAPQPQP